MAKDKKQEKSQEKKEKKAKTCGDPVVEIQ